MKTILVVTESLCKRSDAVDFASVNSEIVTFIGGGEEANERGE